MNAPELFATTRWTVVLTALDKDAPGARRALEELCRTYWFPLYSYVRHRGYSKEDAEDLTQGFFAGFLAKDSLVSADRGKFRAYLLAALKHYLANAWDKSSRQKRGGEVNHLSLDWGSADTQFQIAIAAPTPEQAFDREWALALLAKVVERLRQECERAGKIMLFDRLKIYLTADRGEVPQAKAAAALGMQESAVRVAVHRLRKRYRELLKDEILQTLADPQELEQEMRMLMGVFA